MATEAFTIAKRPGWGASVTVNIECDPLASMGVKIGLAVRVGHATRANLAGADLTGANLARANLARANLTGAEIRGETVTRIVGQAVRLTPGDQYTFTAFEMEAGGVKVLAGCRWFTIPEFRAHVASHYPDTDKAADTLEILDYLERRAVRVGAIKPDVPTPKKPRTKAKPALATQDPEGGR